MRHSHVATHWQCGRIEKTVQWQLTRKNECHYALSRADILTHVPIYRVFCPFGFPYFQVLFRSRIAQTSQRQDDEHILLCGNLKFKYGNFEVLKNQIYWSKFKLINLPGQRRYSRRTPCTARQSSSRTGAAARRFESQEARYGRPSWSTLMPPPPPAIDLTRSRMLYEIWHIV